MAKEEVEACERAARIFLGIDPNYTAIPAWNKPGIIDNCLAKKLNITEKDSVARMTQFFVLFFTELWQVVVKLQEQGIAGDQFWELGAGSILQEVPRAC